MCRGAGPGPAMGEQAALDLVRRYLEAGRPAPIDRPIVRADGEEPRRAPGSQATRLFVALEVPEEAKDLVEEAFAPARGVPEGSLGPPREPARDAEVPGQDVARLTEWVLSIEEAVGEVEPFDTRLVGVGSFLSAKRGARPGLGSTNPSRWGSSRRRIDAALADEFEPETCPPIRTTVALSDPPLKLPAAYTSTELESEPWSVDHVVLLEPPRAAGARYEPLARFPLDRSHRLLAFEHVFDYLGSSEDRRMTEV